jgi:hypothetical protein
MTSPAVQMAVPAGSGAIGAKWMFHVAQDS